MNSSRVGPWWIAVAIAVGVLTWAPSRVDAQDAEPDAAAAEVEGSTPDSTEEAETADDKVRELLAQLRVLKEEYVQIETALPAMSGADSVVSVRRLQELVIEAIDEVHELAGLFGSGADSLTSDELRGEAKAFFEKIPTALQETLGQLKEEIKAARQEREVASPEQLGQIEDRIAGLEQRIDGLFEIASVHVELMDSIGEDATDLRARLVTALEWRAKAVTGRLQLAHDRRVRVQHQMDQFPEDTTLSRHLDAAKREVESQVESLDAILPMLSGLGVDVTEYRTLVVEVTGELARGLTHPNVLWALIQTGAAKLWKWILSSGPSALVKIGIFATILLLSRLVAGLVRKGVSKSLESSRVKASRLLRNMVIGMSGNVVMGLGLLVALSQMGVSLAPMLAGLGVAGFIVGFALQDTLSNFAAGMMILLYRPFDVGDTVEVAGVSGKVHDMSLVSTTILTFDNQSLIIPNGKIWGDVIRNVTHQRTRRVDLVFGISYSDDIPHAEGVLKSIVEGHDRVLERPEPNIRVHELADSSVNFIVRPWVKTEDYWDVKWDLIRAVKIQFDEQGIGIPFPQRDVHVFHEDVTLDTDAHLRSDRVSVSGPAQPDADPQGDDESN